MRKRNYIFLIPGLCLLCLGWKTTLNGQTQIYFQDFEGLSCPGGPSNCNQPLLHPSCINGGGSSHGTPHITPTDFFLPGGTIAVHMGASVEGGFFPVNFECGREYTISFNYLWRAHPFETTINVVLANGLVHNGSSCSGSIPNIPASNRQNVGTITKGQIGANNDAVDQFFSYKVTFCAEVPAEEEIEETFSQLWIYPTGSQGVVFIDNIRVTASCDDDLSVTNNSSPLPTGYHAVNFIETDFPNNTNDYISTDFTSSTSTILQADFFIHLKDNTIIPTPTVNNNFALLKIAPCQDCFMCEIKKSGADVTKAEKIDDNPVEPKINLYPNPTSDMINLEVSLPMLNKNDEHINVLLVNCLGQVKKEFSFPSTIHLKEQLDLSNVEAGIYWISVRLGNERISANRRILLIR